MQIGYMPAPSATPMYHYADLQAMAQAAEAANFTSFWVADHLIFRFPNQPEEGMWECFTNLGGLAATTQRIQLGTLVACVSFRNPALLAKIADTLDDMSGGRFILGLGAGWHEPEYQAFGYPFDHLASRFEEALRIIVPLLREGAVDFHGAYSSATNAKLIPKGPSPKGPQILIGASKPRMLALTAKYADAYNTVWHNDPAKVAAAFATMRAACEAEGRDPATLQLTAGAIVEILEPGATPAGGRVISGTVAEVTEALRGFAAVGVQHLIINQNNPTVAKVQQLAPVVAALQ